MLCKLVLLALPVLLSATCNEEGCTRGGARIQAGDATQRTTRPFQVALYSRVGTTGDVGFCGGALVQPQWVLTAAHCCYHQGELVNHVQAILGAYSLYDRYENGRRVVNVQDIVVRPDYDPTTFANDLALLRLANTLQITESVSPVRLPYRRISGFNFAGLAGTASGWGIAAPGVTFISPTLREKRMTLMSESFCQTEYQGQLPANMVCGFNQTAGTCKGDNGGPLTIFWEATEEVILVGVASFVDASGCNRERPSIFSRVQGHLDWISQITGMTID